MRAVSNRQAGVLMSYAYSITQIVVQLIYVPLLLAGIGKAEYGVYQLVGSIMAYLTVINTVLAAGITKFYSKAYLEGDREKMENTLAIAKRIHWVISAIAVAVIAIVGFISVRVYANSFTSPQLHEMGMMFVVLAIDMVVIMNNTINIAVITAHERFVFLKGTQLFTALLQPCLVLICMRIWPSAFMVACCTLSANLLCAILQRVFAQSVLKTRYTYHGMDKQLVKEMLQFSSAAVLVALSDQVFWKSGQLVLGYFRGAEDVAVFAIGAQIYSVYIVIGTTVATVFLPKITDLYLHSKHPEKEASSLFITVGRISLYVSLFILLAFAILGPEFIRLWAGEGYQEAYLVALIVMIPYTVDIIQNLGLTILQVVNRYQFRGYLNSGLAILNIAITIPLVILSGIVGASIASAISVIIGNCIIMNLYYWKRIGLDIPAFWKNIARITLPLFFIGLIGLFIWNSLNIQGWGALICFGIGFFILYLLVAQRFCFNEYERGIVRELLIRFHH